MRCSKCSSLACRHLLCTRNWSLGNFGKSVQLNFCKCFCKFLSKARQFSQFYAMHHIRLWPPLDKSLKLKRDKFFLSCNVHDFFEGKHAYTDKHPQLMKRNQTNRAMYISPYIYIFPNLSNGYYFFIQVWRRKFEAE